MHPSRADFFIGSLLLVCHTQLFDREQRQPSTFETGLRKCSRGGFALDYKSQLFAYSPTTQKSYKSYRSYKSYLVKFTVTTPAQTTVILGNKRLRYASKNVHGKHDGESLAVIHL